MPTDEERAESRRVKFRRSMDAIDCSDVVGRLQSEKGMQRTKLTRSRNRPAPDKGGEVSTAGVVATIDGDPVVVEDPNPYGDSIKAYARDTPEVRFSKAHMLRPFNDDELKIIAATLRSDTALYRAADVLHCSIHKIENAIRDIPVLTELAQERVSRRKMRAQEAVDDCVKARVPAVVMWNAEKILPEIYGNQVDLNNEDDTRLIIGGAIPEDEVAAAEAAVVAAAEAVPFSPGNAVLEAMDQEQGREMAKAGGILPMEPLSQVPPAPALNPPLGDSRFANYAESASRFGTPVPRPAADAIPDNDWTGDTGDDDFGGGDWI